MTIKPIITVAQLVSAGACSDQVDLFRKTFGESTTVTVAKARKAASLFEWTWARNLLLDASAWAEYRDATAPARAEYREAIAPAQAEYDKAIASAQAEYDKAIASARAAAYIASESRKAGL